MDSRLRRLEKTVESLSHGLIFALTQLKSGDVPVEPRRRGSGPGRRHRRTSHSNAKNESVSRDDAIVDDDDDNDDWRNLSTAFSGMGLLENGAETSTSSCLSLCHF